MKKWLTTALLCAALFPLTGCGANKTAQQDDRHRQATAIRQLGEAYLAEKNFTMALAQFMKAEKMAPDDHLLHQDLGIAYMAKGQVALAIPHFKKAIDIKPDFAAARNNLGAAYIALEDWDAAIACFEVLTKDLLYATPHYPLANMAKAYYEKKNYGEAQRYYKEALKVEPGFVNALYGLGKTHMATGTVKKAAEYFERATEAAPMLADAHFELGNAYRLLGDYAKAEKAFERVVALSPPQSELAREAKEARFKLPF